MSSVSMVPDPLAHGASGTVVFDTASERQLWCQVTLESATGGILQIAYLHVSAGDVTFTPGATPSWDGIGSADGHLRLFEIRANGRQHDLAESTFAYLA